MPDTAVLSAPLGPWLRAERELARPLAGAAAGLARLDERLAGDGATTLRAVQRLAEVEAVALVRSAGGRLPLDTFLLWRHGAPGRNAEPQALLAAARAVRRLAAPAGSAGGIPGNPAALAAFLGGSGDDHGVPGAPPADPGPERPATVPAGSPAGRPPADRRRAGGWHEAATAFLADLRALGDLHPLTRAAAVPLLWQGRDLGSRDGGLESAVIAARIAAEGQTCLGFAPVGAILRARGDARAPDRLGAFLIATAERCRTVLAAETRRRDWARVAAEAAAGLPGRLPAAVVDLTGAETLVSANLVRDRLGVSQQAANLALRRLTARGLVEEVSGQRRYRLWRARL
jgi:ribosomal protein S25